LFTKVPVKLNDADPDNLKIPLLVIDPATLSVPPFKYKTAPAPTLAAVELVTAPVISNVPPLTVVAPLYELDPDRIIVPPPDFVNPPDPENPPEKVVEAPSIPALSAPEGRGVFPVPPSAPISGLLVLNCKPVTVVLLLTIVALSSAVLFPISRIPPRYPVDGALIVITPL